MSQNTNRDYSALIKNLESRTIFANVTQQITKYDQGCGGVPIIQTGSAAVKSSSSLLFVRQGALFTNPTVQSSIISSASCPVVSRNRPVVRTNINVRVLGGATDINTMATALQNARIGLGYSATLTITTNTSGTPYTANDLAGIDVVIIFDSGGISYNSAIGTNLQAFVDRGGHLILCSFVWGNASAIPNFTYATYSPFVFYTNGGSFPVSVNGASLTFTQVHPITTGLPTALGPFANWGAINIADSPTTAGTTVIATYPSSKSCIAIKTKGSANIVGLNFYPAYSYATYPNVGKFVCNSVYWCVGLLT